MSVNEGQNKQESVERNKDVEEDAFSDDSEGLTSGEAMADPTAARASQLREQCRKWIVSLKSVLDDPDGRQVFNLYLDHQVATGGDKELGEQAAWLFFLACSELKTETDPATQRSTAQSIFNHFVRSRGDDGQRRHDTVSLLQHTEADLLRKFHNWPAYRGEVSGVFDEAQRECKRMLEWSCYPAFRDSTFFVDWMSDNGVYPHEVLHPELGLCEPPALSTPPPAKASSGHGRPATGIPLSSEPETGRQRNRKERGGLPEYSVVVVGDDGMTPRERMRQEDLYRDWKELEPSRSFPQLSTIGPARTIPPPIPPRTAPRLTDLQRKTDALLQLETIKQRCQPYLQRQNSDGKDSHDILMAHANRAGSGSPPDQPETGAVLEKTAWMASTALQMKQQGSVLCTTDSGVGRSSASEVSRLEGTGGAGHRPVRKETVAAPGSLYNYQIPGYANCVIPAEITVMWQMESKGEWFSSKYGRPSGSGPHWQKNIRFLDIKHILPGKYRDDRNARFYCKTHTGPRECVWQEVQGPEPVPLFDGRVMLRVMAE